MVAFLYRSYLVCNSQTRINFTSVVDPRKGNGSSQRKRRREMREVANGVDYSNGAQVPARNIIFSYKSIQTARVTHEFQRKNKSSLTLTGKMITILEMLALWGTKLYLQIRYKVQL